MSRILVLGCYVDLWDETANAKHEILEVLKFIVLATCINTVSKTKSAEKMQHLCADMSNKRITTNQNT